MSTIRVSSGKKIRRKAVRSRIPPDAGCACPSRCFCKYRLSDLLAIGYRKLRLHIPTVDLMRDARSRKEREAVCVVSMLDLDNIVAEIMIREHMADATCDVMSCRDSLRKRLLRALKSYRSDDVPSRRLQPEPSFPTRRRR